MTLQSLPPLLRDEPALADAVGGHRGVVAVPEAGRAITVAALAQLGGRSPLGFRHRVALRQGSGAQSPFGGGNLSRHRPNPI